MTLGDDLVADRRVERAAHAVQQQRACSAVVEPLDGHLGEPGEEIVTEARSRRAYERDPLARKPAGGETDDLRGRLVEPLRVVDHADERPLRSKLRQQAEYGQTDDKAIGRRFRAQAERRRERIALRGGQALPEIEHRAAKLMQPPVCKLHLGLDARSSCDTTPGRPSHQVLQQRRLAGPQLATQDQHPTLTPPGTLQQCIECVPLATPTMERWPAVTIRHGTTRAPVRVSPRADARVETPITRIAGGNSLRGPLQWLAGMPCKCNGAAGRHQIAIRTMRTHAIADICRHLGYTRHFLACTLWDPLDVI